ncbi:glycerol-3-phosphate dehydrogenase/oxidase [Cytobacillus sp. Hm23]
MEKPFSSMNRIDILKQVASAENDLIIIGGGITGAGIALDAATRGMKTVVLEMQDFAAGTSSRSTKLVHGGLRYLKQFEVKMVSEVGKEREIVYENGPHVTTPQWMMLPFYKGGTFGPLSTSFGLRIYDFLAGVKKNERRIMLDENGTLSKEPLLKKVGLKGSGYYVEYRTDDARLTIEVMKEAVRQGASAVNYAKVEKFVYEKGKIIGVEAVDQITGELYFILAKQIVNATGPWVDSIREKDITENKKSLQLTKGVHLVIDGKRFPLRQAVYFDTEDKRMVFAIPREGKTYIGTTDTKYSDDISHPTVTASDRQYVIDAINYMFPEVKVTNQDVESSWAGLRPLIYEDGKDPSEISRKDEIWQSSTGLITIAGGKLTGYRKMAETVVDLVARLLEQTQGLTFSPCNTQDLPISGGHVGGSLNFQNFIQEKIDKGIKLGVPRELANFFVHRYGSNVDQIFFYYIRYAKQRTKNDKLLEDIYAQVLYSIEEEMAMTPVDFFMRRTGALLFNIDWVEKWKEPVIKLMSTMLGWDTDRENMYIHELDELLTEARFISD